MAPLMAIAHVVVSTCSKPRLLVNVDRALGDKVPVIKRYSGGGTVRGVLHCTIFTFQNIVPACKVVLDYMLASSMTNNICIQCCYMVVYRAH